MDFIENSTNFILIVSLLLLSIFLYFILTRRLRIAALKKIGFTVTTKITPPLVRLLYNYAPEYMTPESIKTEKLKKKYTKRLLIKWYGHKNILNHDVHCWSYRLTELEYGLGRGEQGRLVNHWWQGIYINGLAEKDQVPFIQQSRIELGADIKIEEFQDSLLIIYKRPLYSFKASLLFLQFSIDKIKRYQSQKKGQEEKTGSIKPK